MSIGGKLYVTIDVIVDSQCCTLARLLVRGNLSKRYPEWSGNTYLERGKKSAAIVSFRVRAAGLSNELQESE